MILALVIDFPVSLRSVGQLATTLVAMIPTKFSFFFPHSLFFSHRKRVLDQKIYFVKVDVTPFQTPSVILGRCRWGASAPGTARLVYIHENQYQ